MFVNSGKERTSGHSALRMARRGFQPMPFACAAAPTLPRVGLLQPLTDLPNRPSAPAQPTSAGGLRLYGDFQGERRGAHGPAGVQWT